ncbi:inositol monophosphatase [Apiospora aurea]|uniref:Inositol-1-monophosphatase n=1 Tax=Apiospora aurea TaxID=335848 RepID=A0ABR1Q7A7_9PEZI
MANLDLPTVRMFLIEVAKEAGLIITRAGQSQVASTNKKNGTDIVTETDQEVEAHIAWRLKDRYPTFGFLGEESYKSGTKVLDKPTFIVDPIDGTSNFVHHFPAVCVSLGLVVSKRPAVGVVYNPFDDELWAAVQGGGAYMQKGGGQVQKLPLYMTPLESLQSACIGIEWGSDRDGPNFELNLKVFTTLVRSTRTGGRFVNSLRGTGSAAIAICRTAAGQQDMFWECGCWVWDVAAAWCILSEAGGIMVDGHPGNWEPPIDNRRYLAVRPATTGQKEVVEEFWSTMGDQRSLYGPP